MHTSWRAIQLEPFCVSFFWAVLLCLLSLLLIVAGKDPNQVVNLVTALNLSFVALFAWFYTEKGQSFLFLFIVTFILFLGGRFITPFLGYDYQPEYVGFGEGTFVGVDTHRTFAYLLNACVVAFVLAIVKKSTPVRPLPIITQKSNAGLKRLLAVAFFVFLPFYLYKNYTYFNYIMENGGYVAIYLSRDHIETVGVLSRAGALICFASILARVFFADNRKEFMGWALILVSIFWIELAIGLRGKFFVTVLSIFFLYLVRFERSLPIVALLLLFLSVAGISVVVEVFRENKEQSSLVGTLLVGFLHQQSVSSDVVKGVIALGDKLPGSGFDYLIRQLMIPFIHPTEVSSGWVLSDDYSQLVMPNAYRNGFGTGSSYLAELYLVGGLPIVFLVNFGLALFLKTVRPSVSLRGYILFIALIGLMYFPRTTLQDPVHMILRYVIIITPIFFFTKLLIRRSECS